MTEQIKFILSVLGESTENRPLSKSIEIIYNAFVKNKDLVSINIEDQKREEMAKRLKEGNLEGGKDS